MPPLAGQISDSLIYLLQRRGIGRDEVRFVQLPFAAMADQLRAGRIDVAVAGPPFKTAMATPRAPASTRTSSSRPCGRPAAARSRTR